MALSTHSIASRNPYADREDYGGSGNFGLIFLFTVVPILFWAISKFLKKNSANKSIEYERKLREHTDQLVKEFAEKNKVQPGEKNNNPLKKEEPKPIVISPEALKKPSRVEEKPQVEKEFPKLTEQERECALSRLRGHWIIKCYNCDRVDDLINFNESSAGDRFRFCCKCNTHFELDQFTLKELEEKINRIFYLRCPNCMEVVKKAASQVNNAGYGLKKCPICLHNF